MLKVAHDSGDPAEIRAVAKAVKAVFPDYEAAIAADANAKVAALEPAQEENFADAPRTGPKQKHGLFALSPWDGKVSASGVLSSGNSENAAVGVAIDAARTAGAWKHNFKGYLDLGESNGVTNQKRWGASYKLDYNFGERTYAYGRVSYDEDQFSGFDYRLFGGAGLGHYLFKGEPFSWKVEGGPGYRFSPVSGTTMEENEFAVYAATEIDWLIRQGVKFDQDVNITWTSPTTSIQSVTALTTQIWGDISTGLSFEYRYETDPPMGRKNTDTIAKASLIYGF
jgi:putative salt-induced outer membrane protein YdiY